MSIKINDMLSEIADDEIFNWGVENKPAVQHSILSRVTDVDDKIPGFDKGTTCIFNRATYIDDSIICCVAVNINDEIVLYTLAKSSFIGFSGNDYDNYSWDMRALEDGFDSKEITYAKAFANVADRAWTLVGSNLGASLSRPLPLFLVRVHSLLLMSLRMSFLR